MKTKNTANSWCALCLTCIITVRGGDETCTRDEPHGAESKLLLQSPSRDVFESREALQSTFLKDGAKEASTNDALTDKLERGNLHQALDAAALRVELDNNNNVLERPFMRLTVSMPTEDVDSGSQSLLVGSARQSNIVKLPGRQIISTLPVRAVLIQAYTKATRISPDLLNKALERNSTELEWAVGVALNMHYATRQGYAHVLWSLAGEDDGGVWSSNLENDGCKNSAGVKISSHWCKIVATKATLDLFPSCNVFMLLDTDAVVTGMDFSIEQYLQRSVARTCRNSTSPMDASVVGWRNTPEWGGCDVTVSGTLIFKRDNSTLQLLDRWLSQSGGWDDHDQPAFNRVKGREVATFDEPTCEPADSPQWLIHRCGLCDKLPPRLAVMRKVMTTNALTEVELVAAIKDTSVYDSGW